MTQGTESEEVQDEEDVPVKDGKAERKEKEEEEVCVYEFAFIIIKST